jgi:hypothetical protein
MGGFHDEWAEAVSAAVAKNTIYGLRMGGISLKLRPKKAVMQPIQGQAAPGSIKREVRACLHFCRIFG